MYSLQETASRCLDLMEVHRLPPLPRVNLQVLRTQGFSIEVEAPLSPAMLAKPKKEGVVLWKYCFWRPMPKALRRQIIKELKEGDTYLQIGDRHGISDTAVGNIARKANLRRRPRRSKVGMEAAA